MMCTSGTLIISEGALCAPRVLPTNKVQKQEYNIVKKERKQARSKQAFCVEFLPLCFCQRMCEVCVCVCVFSVCTVLYRYATHPYLLSSSGSGPVELEPRAQLLLSASEDFILRAKKTHKNKPVSTSKDCGTFLQLGGHNMIAQKNKTMTKQDAGGSFNTKL